MRVAINLHRVVAALLLVCAAAGVTAQAQGTAQLNLVFVLDGLRPDSINATDTPNLFRLRNEGVNFINSHSVFPTVTRVNATALGSGMYPGHNGMMGNNIYVPAVNPVASFSNDSMKNLLRMDDATHGKVVMVPTLAEYLQAAGKRFVVVSSGSSGGAFLLAPKVVSGTGALVHAETGGELKPAYPEAFASEVVKRFGLPPKKGGANYNHMASVNWAMDVLRDYVLPEMKPQLVFTWMTEPDHTQHAHGIGAPETVATIRNDDRQLGVLLQRLDTMGLHDKVNIMVVSDHGFSQVVYGVNLKQALVEAGLMPAENSDEVVIASSGESVLLHVKNRDAAKIDKIAAFLKQQSWCGVLFTAGDPAKPGYAGRVPGTFSLELIHLDGSERSPDLVLTFPWSSAANAQGIPGTDSYMVSTATGPMAGVHANHGSMSPWTVRNTMLAWGPDFKHGVTLRTPSANVDVAPTLLYLLGESHADKLDGRVLSEALVNGPDPEKITADVRTLRVEDGDFRSVIQITETGGKRYIDKSWRE
jgi:arylsulfatase A-like enzyme